MPGRAEQPGKWIGSRIAGQFADKRRPVQFSFSGIKFRCLVHRPELEHGVGLFVPANTDLTEEDRPRITYGKGNGRTQPNWRKRNDGSGAKANIQCAFPARNSCHTPLDNVEAQTIAITSECLNFIRAVSY